MGTKVFGKVKVVTVGGGGRMLGTKMIWALFFGIGISCTSRHVLHSKQMCSYVHINHI